ncbi:hypothetical protein D6D01_10288 [Aureobasidium pullulans]|uniref:Uncharacterized protein n=1 Tax=Aureobasidium pullulans TaxID=5580 RepID=A0A4S9JJF3_AURPU|nr:hypothetical protein D6D01_10288 [Aureobasidium pullulans]
MAVSSRHPSAFPSSATTSQQDNPQIMTLPARPAISPDDTNVSNDVSEPYTTTEQEDHMNIVPPETPGRLQEHVSTDDRTVHKVENEAPNITDASSDAPIAVQEDIAISDDSDIQQRALVIQNIDHLKSRNKDAIYELAHVQTEVNRHLVECQDHHLQLTQWRFVYGPAISVITIGHNNTIGAHETQKIALASRLVEHDIKRIKSLGAFYRTQKQYFRLLEIMKKREVGIQEASGEASLEFMGSKERLEMLEQSRVQMTETWLEWLEELA